ncbi:daxx-like protein [Sitodiplosis mosellana]|uniref:daxx-like protein n=1 Tax=Sitodiplosis mosellana TaxID=263140 RepID=UPI0024452F46|nr:daxx-like protein [Sitodiplosis mosellana]
MDNVIILLSSDEEDNDGGVTDKIRQNKNIVIKKVRASSVPQNVKNIPMQKVSLQKLTTPIVHQKNTNINTKPVTVIQAFRQQNQQPASVPNRQQAPVLLKSQQSPLLSHKQSSQLLISTVPSKDGKPVAKKPTPSLSSGITITPVKLSTVIATNHGNSTVSNMGTVTITPRTDKVTIVPKPTVSTVKSTVKSIHVAISKPAKRRVVPIKISDAVTMRASSMEKSSDSDMLSRDSSSIANDEVVPINQANGTNKPEEYEPTAKRPRVVENAKRPMHEDYIRLIEVCKSADPTQDMNKIVTKLEKYYYRAHADYVNSKSFHRLVEGVTSEIEAQPKLVYMKINNLLGELKTRKPMESVAVATEENTKMSEADEKKAKQIEKLSGALRSLQFKIRKCEEAEVDWEDEINSKYCLTERYKQRACEIYNKLCDLTGESRNAERISKKPIKFKGIGITRKYPEFNRKLEKFINETKSFPDMFDVLRIIDHCSERYHYRMSVTDRKTIAQEAFMEVGTLLQKRRKADLYEMVQYFAANHNDPASDDPLLKSKLEESQRHYNKRMKEVIAKFTMDPNDSEVNEEKDSPVKAKEKPKTSVVKVSTSPPTSAHPIEPTLEPPELNINAEIDLLNDSVTSISDSGEFNDISKTDSILTDEQDVVHELEREFLPTITSVTSLHPNEFNDLMNFELTPSNQMESMEIS